GLYQAFQLGFRKYVSDSCHSEFAREHYTRLFQPLGPDEFIDHLARMSPRKRQHRTKMWKKGFDHWLRCELGKQQAARRRAAEFGYSAEVERIVRRLQEQCQRPPGLLAEDVPESPSR